MISTPHLRFRLPTLLPGFLAAVVAVLLPAPAWADQRADFLAGRSKICRDCDLAGANFKRRDLTGADLTGANLQHANLHDARLTGAKLAGADLTAANLNKANL